MKCPNIFVIFGHFAERKLAVLLKLYEQIVNFSFSSTFQQSFEQIHRIFQHFFAILSIFGAVFSPLLQFLEISTRCGGKRFSAGQFVGGKEEMKNLDLYNKP